MKRLRVSYSMLSAMKRGDLNSVVSMYLHKDMPRTVEQQEGLDYHKRWGDAIMKNKAVKIGAGEYIFNSPKIEEKHEVEYGEDFTLVGVFDCIDDKRLYEFKSGTQDVFSYVNSYQLPIYFLIAKLKDIKIDEAWLIHYNQYENKGEMAIVKNTDKSIEEASNYVDTLGGMVKNYLQQINLI